MRTACYCFFAALALTSCRNGGNDRYREWKVYGGSKESIHYSALTQVDTSNVGRLQLAWEYHTHDTDRYSQIQVNPIIAHGALYGVSPRLKLFAVEAATGRPQWIFDPADASPPDATGHRHLAINACRGIALYDGGKDDQ